MDNGTNLGLGPNERELIDAEIGTSPAPELDPADYLADMEGFDMDEAQKIALLETLWAIMRSFVEMDVDIARADPCGQIFGDFSAAAAEGVASHRSKAAETPTGHNHKKKEDAHDE